MTNKKFSLSKLIIHTVFIIYGLICFLPLVLVLSISITSESALATGVYSLIPKVFTLDAYRYIFSGDSPIPKAYLITTIATVLGVVLNLAISSLLAYGISRNELKYKNAISFFLIICLLFNGGLVPWYILISKYLHLSNNIAAMFVPYLVSVVHIMMMRNFFATIPDSIVESARIDGSGEFNTFIKIILPLSTPILATIGLFVAVFLWNDWMTTSLFIDDPKLYGLQFLLQSIMNNIAYLQGNPLLANNASVIPSESARMATCILAVGPILFAYPLLQRYFTKGLTLGAVKQ